MFVLVAVGFAVSLNLLRRVVGFTSPWFALTVMLAFLGLVRFASPFYLLKLPRTLRKLHPWEVSSKRHPIWGVGIFGQLLRRTPLRHLNPVVYLSQHPGDFDAVQRRVESAEAAHLWAAVLITPYICYACIQKWWSMMAWFVVLQVVGNLYPILHLRLIRGRLLRCLDKKASKHGVQNVPSGAVPNKQTSLEPTAVTPVSPLSRAVSRVDGGSLLGRWPS